MTHLTTTAPAQKNSNSMKAAFILIASLIASPSFATDSAHHTSQAGKHSALAVSHGAASTAKVASAVVAVPFIAVGSVMQGAGNLSTSAGNALMPNKKELTITTLTITADANPQATMKKRVSEEKNTINTTETITTQKTVITSTEVKEKK